MDLRVDALCFVLASGDRVVVAASLTRALRERGFRAHELLALQSGGLEGRQVDYAIAVGDDGARPDGSAQDVIAALEDVDARGGVGMALASSPEGNSNLARFLVGTVETDDPSRGSAIASALTKLHRRRIDADPFTFEQSASEALVGLGFDSVVRAHGEGGYDFVARAAASRWEGEWIVEAKLRHGRALAVTDIAQAVATSGRFPGSRVLLMTDGYLTSPAMRFAAEHSQRLTVVAGSDLWRGLMVAQLSATADT